MHHFSLSNHLCQWIERCGGWRSLNPIIEKDTGRHQFSNPNLTNYDLLYKICKIYFLKYIQLIELQSQRHISKANFWHINHDSMFLVSTMRIQTDAPKIKLNTPSDRFRQMSVNTTYLKRKKYVLLYISVTRVIIWQYIQGDNFIMI